MGTIIISQIFMISVFKFWPEQEIESYVPIFFEKEAFIVEEMIVTKQTNTPASPPKPQIPIPVPNDIVIEDIIEFPELEELISFDSLSISITTGQRGDEERISGNPDRVPRISRIVEPTLTSEAMAAGIKSMVLVNFLVSSRGIVKEAYIAEIRLYEGSSERYEVVKDLEYGILQDVLEAAYKWRFRPAEEDGEQVGAYIQEAFLIGF
jgi:hypothetical protein